VLFINKDGSTRLENPNSETLAEMLKQAIVGFKG
jgi:hypothetical protein